MILSTEQQVVALAQAMSTLPAMTGPRPAVVAPARILWARELVEKWGVSIDPTRAVLEAVNENPAQMGNHGPQVVRERLSPVQERKLVENARDYVNTNMPDLSARIAAADTAEKQAALRAELLKSIPAPVLKAMAMVEKIDPETIDTEGLP